MESMKTYTQCFVDKGVGTTFKSGEQKSSSSSSGKGQGVCVCVLPILHSCQNELLALTKILLAEKTPPLDGAMVQSHA
ncbi:Uncharacterized protein DAT39_019643 [Clarias magur]|uniref:Uncharacterized protein n=1 Tax=Clarias magur TaxID=1594786 RepID=A0A8J4X1U0_CLAMG|nr:Uncharacterized protein DAT39_019643 [Clarias magur]